MKTGVELIGAKTCQCDTNKHHASFLGTIYFNKPYCFGCTLKDNLMNIKKSAKIITCFVILLQIKHRKDLC